MFFNHTTPHRLELSGEVLGRDLPCPEGPSGDGLSGCAPSPIVRRVIVDAKGCAGMALLKAFGGNLAISQLR